MATRFRLNFEQIFGTSAQVLAGGTLTFCISGGAPDQLQAIYSDDALTVTKLNPVTLDSAGKHGDIFLQAKDYRVIVKDAAGIVQPGGDVDPVHGGSSDASWAGTLADALALFPAPISVANGQALIVAGRTAVHDGYEGVFLYKALDSTTVFPNSALGFVDAAGRRWFRAYEGNAGAVEWFGAIGDGVAIDRAAWQVALNTVQQIWCRPGAVYNLGPIATAADIFPLSGRDGISISFNGAKIIVQTTADVCPGLFSLDNCAGFTLDRPWIEDSGFDQTKSNPWHGIAVVRFNPVSGEVRDTVVKNARYKGVVAAFDTTSAAHRVRGIWFTGDIKDSYYGIALSNNGDDLFADYRTDNLVRSYFVYGVNNHEFVLYSYNHAPSNADCLIKSKDPAFPTTNIRGRFVSIASTVPTGEQLAFESQNDSGDAVIRDCWIDYNDVQSPGLNFSIGFRHYNNASVLQANDPNTKTDIHIRGFASKGILHDSAATAPQRQTFNGMGVYTVAMLPPPTRLGETVYVTNENGGGTLAFTAGTTTPGEGVWLRVQDRAVVS